MMSVAQKTCVVEILTRFSDHHRKHGYTLLTSRLMAVKFVPHTYEGVLVMYPEGYTLDVYEISMYDATAFSLGAARIVAYGRDDGRTGALLPAAKLGIHITLLVSPKSGLPLSGDEVRERISGRLFTCPCSICKGESAYMPTILSPIKTVKEP